MSGDDIRNVSVIGAGDMGHGIAEVALLAGVPVCLYDITPEAVERGRARIFESAAKLAEKGKLPSGLHDAIRTTLLTTSTDLERAVASADLVIEAIPELLPLKKKVFADLDAATPPHALLASNTSTMRISDIAAATRRPDKVLGLHFFNPAVLMRLVEVIRGDATSADTIARSMAFVQKVRKLPVVVRKDTPGFIANRVNQAPAVLLGLMLERGEVTPEGLDGAMRLVGSAMGPCELTDFVGIDVAVHASRYFAEALDPEYGPAPHLVKMYEEGKLGKKSGQGYFDWSQGRPAIDLRQAARSFTPLHPIALQINEATKLVEDGVCSIAEVDLALVNSSGNPVGPMSFGRMISRWDLTDLLEGLADKYHRTIFRPTQKVRDGGHKR